MCNIENHSKHKCPSDDGKRSSGDTKVCLYNSKIFSELLEHVPIWLSMLADVFLISPKMNADTGLCCGDTESAFKLGRLVSSNGREASQSAVAITTRNTEEIFCHHPSVVNAARTPSDSRPVLRPAKPRFKLFYCGLKPENLVSSAFAQFTEATNLMDRPHPSKLPSRH